MSLKFYHIFSKGFSKTLIKLFDVIEIPSLSVLRNLDKT